RSAPDSLGPTSDGEAAAMAPAFRPNAVYSPDGNFIGNFPQPSALEEALGGSQPDVNTRRLGRRGSSAFPEIVARDPNQPMLPAEAGPLLGLVSGKPMSPQLL